MLLQFFDIEVAAVLHAAVRVMDKSGEVAFARLSYGHTQSYDFQAARINKCFKLLTGYSR